MKRRLYILSGLFLFSLFSNGQIKNYPGNRNFPLILTLQFHALSFPFKDILANFSNPGIGISTELGYDSRQRWLQQLGVLWYRNRNSGSGILIMTEIVWRPVITGGFYGEIKTGLGYDFLFHPVESYRPVNGNWVSKGRNGKGVLTILVGISAGYEQFTGAGSVSPFVSYQFLLLKDYNNSIPLLPETLLQAGAGVHF